MSIKSEILEKIIKKICIASIAISFSVWLYNYIKTQQEFKLKYKESAYCGVIKDTIHYQLQHDLPTYIFTNDSSHFSGVGETYMQVRAKLGDSLSKVSGSDTVYIFRKIDENRYVQIPPGK